MHTFLVLLPTAHFAANACLYATPPPGSFVYIAWPLLYVHCSCCMCISYDLFTVQLYCMSMAGDICAWQMACICIMYMYLLYVHDRCWLCMNDVVYAWHMKDVYDNLCMYNVHGRCCLGITDDVCMTAVVSTWPQLPVHDSGCHSMAAPVCTWQKLCTICGVSTGEVQSEFGLIVCPVRLCIMAAGQHWQNMAREISLSLLLSPDTSITIHVEQMWAPRSSLLTGQMRILLYVQYSNL